MKLTLSVLFCGLLVAVSAERFTYEFGTEDPTSTVINSSSGSIGLLQFSTDINIPVPPGLVVKHVQVTVDALAPPKVDYDSLYNRVTIRYSWLQITRSSYSIVAKGNPI